MQTLVNGKYEYKMIYIRNTVYKSAYENPWGEGKAMLHAVRSGGTQKIQTQRVSTLPTQLYLAVPDIIWVLCCYFIDCQLDIVNNFFQDIIIYTVF